VPRTTGVEDVDLAPDGSAIAAVRFGSALRIVGPDWDIEAPIPVPFPRIRLLDRHRILLVNSRTDPDVANAWILHRQHGTLAHFYVGDAVAEIVVSPPFIAVTYFDEAYGSDGPAGEGVSFFDFEGHSLWGYATHFADEAVDTMDVYAATGDEAGYLWFYPYTDFPLVRLDIHAREQRIFTPPAIVHGSSGLSVHNGTAYFVSPYDQWGAAFEWALGAPTARRIATIPGRVRGLPGGRFIASEIGEWSVNEDLGGTPHDARPE
jgi:hypothetical protein